MHSAGLMDGLTVVLMAARKVALMVVQMADDSAGSRAVQKAY